MKYPTISLAIPTYNESVNIDRCLASVFNDSYPGQLEVFVIDGGSTDQTLNLARKYPVIVLNNLKKQAEYGKKIALDAARGDFFMILDCDMSLEGKNWFKKMVTPLMEDPILAGSFAGFTYHRDDAPLNRYISFDPIQRDPLFSFLTPAIKSVTVKKCQGYRVVNYAPGKILPAGFVLNRVKDLQETGIFKRKKYMELDNLSIFVKNGKTRYVYREDVYLYHPFLTTLSNLVRKRVRNLETMYFNQPDPREWTWINWQAPAGFIKLFFWIIYVYSIVPSVLVGLSKSIKYKDWAGMLELPFNIVTTSAIIFIMSRKLSKLRTFGR
jgi:glycosyltransferase involved in cell wall biosynthesis